MLLYNAMARHQLCLSLPTREQVAVGVNKGLKYSQISVIWMAPEQFVTDVTKELNDIVIIDVMQLDAVNELEL